MNDPRVSGVNEALDMGWKDKPPSVPSFFKRVMRQAWIVVLCVIVSVAGAFGIAVISDPLYTAQVALFLDGEGELQLRGEDATAIDLHTQVELIRSDQTTLAVIEANGGRIVKPVFSFPGGRRFHFADPHGNELAVWSDQ